MISNGVTVKRLVKLDICPVDGVQNVINLGLYVGTYYLINFISDLSDIG